ncbi:immunoglobulin-like domain-containing protein [Blautia sp. GBKS_5]|uniref:immunoglobulin-like domain-containing protein n=1 Tax=Blautia sp. GBKS_5 TaxID=3459305 RepID=UPI00403D4044
MNFKKAAATSSAIVIGATTILTGIPTSVSAAQVHTEVVQEELSTKETQAETKVGEDTKKEVKTETETQKQDTQKQETSSEEGQNLESPKTEETAPSPAPEKPETETETTPKQEEVKEESEAQQPQNSKEETPTEEKTEETQPVGIKIDETNFPDAVFRAELEKKSYGEDGVLTPEEISKIDRLNINNPKITSLQGIQYFTELTSIYIANTKITNLDLIGLNKMDTIHMAYNSQLSSLKISLPALKNLSCTNNGLTTLSIDAPALELLKCQGNKLTSLSVDGSKVRSIECYNNELQTLSLNTPALEVLSCSDNQLTSLDVSDIKTLTSVTYDNNPPLKTLDFRGCDNLERGYHSQNQETVYISAGMTKYIGCHVVPEHTGNLIIDLNGYFIVNSDGSKSVDLNQVISPAFIKVLEKEGHACFDSETHILTIPAQDKATVLEAGFDGQINSTKWTFYTDITAVDDCVVKFDSMGGTLVDDQMLSNGEKAAEPTVPVKEGYIFTGWYTDKECTTLYDFSAPVTADITLYAGWSTQAVNTPPVITAGDITLMVGDTFDPLTNVTATDKEDGNLILTKDNIAANDVDTKKAGTYHVTYKVTDKNGASTEKTITVTVKENTPPTITAKDITLKVGDSYNPLSGVTAEDKEDGKITLTKDSIIANDVNTSKAGTYHVTYKVTDKNGASTEKTITVTVKKTTKTSTTTKKSPKTGDMANLGLLTSMLAGSSGLIAVLKGKGRRKK